MTISVQGPDGAVNQFPDGTADNVIESAMRQQYAVAAPTSEQSTAKVNSDYLDTLRSRAKETGSPADMQAAMTAEDQAAASAKAAANAKPYAGIEQGMGDPIYGGAQLGLHALPEAMRPNFLPTASQFDTIVQNREKAYQAGRAARGETGTDLSRLGGNLLTTAPLMAVLPGSAPESLMGAMGQGAATGAGQAAIMPSTSNNFWTDKGTQTAIGAAGGGVAGGLGYGVGRAIGGAPAATDDYGKAVQYLQEKGVQPTVGQLSGKTGAKFEDMAQPFSAFGQERALNQFNKAAYNTVLAPIGEKFDGTPGRDAVKAVGDKLSAAYDALVPNLKLVPDAQLQSDFAAAVGKTDEMSEAAAEQFSKIIQKQLPRGPLEGDALKKLQSALTEKVQQFSGSQDPSHQMMADAFSDIRTAITENLARVNPDQAAKLQAIDHGWANLVRLEMASGKTGEGVFTPNQLLSAARQADDSVRSRAIARGMGGDMQDLADAGVKVLSNKYPNSGTAWRNAAAALTLGGSGGAALGGAPGAGLGAGLGAAAIGTTGLAYTPVGQRAISGLMSQRSGQVAPLIGRGVESAAPLLGGGTAAFLRSIMGQ